MSGTTRSSRRVTLGHSGLLPLFALLLGAGCFQPDETADDGIYPAWEPVLAPHDAAQLPVPGVDAGLGSFPTPLPDAGGAAPALDAGRDAAAPGFFPLDASQPPMLADGAANDAARPGDAALVIDTSVANPPGPPPTSLSFSVLTKSLGGRYAPRNIGAIWIENASGKWIKTLAVWAFLRERHLTRFRTASGGNRVDAVTGATLSQHTTHSVTWDLTDATGVPVPDGDYRVVVETTDRDATGSSTEVAFAKGPLPVRSMPPDVTYYVNMSLALE